MADFDPWIRPLISLIGLSGSLAYALAQIRSGIGRSAILLRDFLLDTKVSAETGIPDLIALRISAKLEFPKPLTVQALRSKRELAMDLRLASIDRVPVTREARSPFYHLSEPRTLCVYRIVQKASNNSAKRSGAASVEVVLTSEPYSVAASIGDHSHGFDTAGEAARLGRTLAIDSSASGRGRNTAELRVVAV